jgi:hypothetical protein
VAVAANGDEVQVSSLLVSNETLWHCQSLEEKRFAYANNPPFAMRLQRMGHPVYLAKRKTMGHPAVLG